MCRDYICECLKKVESQPGCYHMKNDKEIQTSEVLFHICQLATITTDRIMKCWSTMFLQYFMAKVCTQNACLFLLSIEKSAMPLVLKTSFLFLLST